MKQIVFSMMACSLLLAVQAQNVGIGTPIPNHPLTVIANASSKGIAQKNGSVEIGFFTNTTSAFVQTWTPHDLNFAANNGPAKLTLAYLTGNVGIGTTSPTAQLDISGSLRLRGNGAAAGRVLGTDASGVAGWKKDSLSLPFKAALVSDDTLFSLTSSGTGPAGYFSLDNAASVQSALRARSNSKGAAFIATGIGEAAATELSASNEGSTLYVFNNNAENKGVGMQIIVRSETSPFPPLPVANFVIFRKKYNSTIIGGVPIAAFQTTARINANGTGFFNGGTQNSGADVAEAFAVDGAKTSYQPGDVLAISSSADRTLTLSHKAYSTTVAGVYATKPGVLLTEKLNDESIDDLVPLGIIGVIPTKVCSEGGAISRGDLLVTSSTPGYAMKGNPAKIKIGMVLGKALENFTTGKTGLIKVLVNVR